MPAPRTAWCSALLASAQVIVVVVVLTSLPETAHRDLDELNPLDRAPA